MAKTTSSEMVAKGKNARTKVNKCDGVDLFEEAIALHKKSLVDSINTKLTEAENNTKKDIHNHRHDFEERCRVLENAEGSINVSLSMEKLLVAEGDDTTSEVTLAQQMTQFSSTVGEKHEELSKLWISLAEVRQSIVQLVVEIFGPLAIEERAEGMGTPERQPEAEKMHIEQSKLFDRVDTEFEIVERKIIALVTSTAKENEEILNSIETDRKGNVTKVRRALRALEREL